VDKQQTECHKTMLQSYKYTLCRMGCKNEDSFSQALPIKWRDSSASPEQNLNAIKKHGTQARWEG